MFAGDSESEFSFNPHEEVIPTKLQRGIGNSKNPNRMENELLKQQLVTLDELEFGWSANLSGVRGLTEQQARRILCFERSLKRHLQSNRSSGDVTVPEEEGTNAVCRRTGIPLYDSPYTFSQGSTSEPFDAITTSNGRTGTHDSRSSDFQYTQPSLPEYRRLASSRLNQSLQISRSQSSFLKRSLRRSKSRASNLTFASDEFLHLPTRTHVGKSTASHANSDEDNTTYQDTKEETDFFATSNPKTGFRGLLMKISRSLMGSNAEASIKIQELEKTIQDDPILCNLSHDMVGAASPFPMRPPLGFGEDHHSTYDCARGMVRCQS